MSKPDIDDSFAQETPDLVLPPDFGKEPRVEVLESRENIPQRGSSTNAATYDWISNY